MPIAKRGYRFRPQRLATLATAAVAILACGTALGQQGPPPVPATGVWLLDFLADVHVRGGFSYTVEDISTGREGPYVGLSSMRLPMPNRKISLRTLLSMIQKDLPGVRAWRDPVNGRTIHVALARAARWKKNPMGARVTIMGRKSLAQVERAINKQIAPGRIAFLYSPPVHGGVAAVPYTAPAMPPTKLRVSVRHQTVERLLTDYLRFRGHSHNRCLWAETIYTKANGTLNRRVAVMLEQVPVGVLK